MVKKKHVVFVIGPALSGKSEYIKKNFPNYKKVDLTDYQHFENDEIFNKCLEGFRDALTTNDNVVLEHTLPKIKHRVPYIMATQEITNVCPEIVVMLPRETIYDNYSTVKRLENYYGIFESPALSDGFSEITVLCN